MADRAFLCGINLYSDAPLSGCVNDVTDMAEFLVEHLDFNPDNIRMLTDKRATTAGILERLQWLVAGAQPGDRIVFHFSGHGVELPSRNPQGEVDGLDQAVCPVNFDWENEVLRDDDFIKIFTALPKGVKGLWISDSCHSGGLDRDLMPPGNPHAPKPKFIPPPADIAWRFRSIEHKGIVAAPRSKSFAGTTAPLPLTFISGCKTKQTSADAWFSNRPNGALTYFLLKALESQVGLKSSMTAIVKNVRAELKRNGYSQVPQLDGLKATFTAPILG